MIGTWYRRLRSLLRLPKMILAVLTPAADFMQKGALVPGQGGRFWASRLRQPQRRRYQMDTGVAFAPTRIGSKIPALGLLWGRSSILHRPDRVIGRGTAIDPAAQSRSGRCARVGIPDLAQPTAATVAIVKSGGE